MLRLLRFVLAATHIIVGLAGLTIALPHLGMLLSADSFSDPVQLRFGRDFVPLVLLFFLPSLVGGLLLLARPRWASWLLLPQALVYLVIVPVGTVLGFATLAILLLPLNRDTPHGVSPGAAGVVLAMLLVGSGSTVGLNLAFRHFGDPAPEPLPELLVPGVIAFAVSIVLFAVYVVPTWRFDLSALGALPDGLRGRRAARTTEAAAKRRLESLAADPRTAPYAALIAQGQAWTNEQIAYDLDPARRVSCPHLHRIEGDMRAAGIRLKPSGTNSIDATCAFDLKALTKRYELAPPLRFLVHPPDRGYGDEVPALYCAEHRFSIFGRDPHCLSQGIPIFPTDA